MSFIESLAAALKPYADFYSHSKPAETVVTFLHIAGVMVGGGLAMASDRMALRLGTAGEDDRRRLLRDFHDVHKPVLISLSVVVVSGAAMVLSDVETFLVSPVYYVKLACFALLLGNGFVMTRTEGILTADPSPKNKAWGRFRLNAMASITLWLATALVGVWLVNAA